MFCGTMAFDRKVVISIVTSYCKVSPLYFFFQVHKLLLCVDSLLFQWTIDFRNDHFHGGKDNSHIELIPWKILSIRIYFEFVFKCSHIELQCL